MIIETKRLRLRPFRADEAGALAAAANDFDIAKMLGAKFPYPYTLADAEAWTAKLNSAHDHAQPLVFAIARRADDVFMGCGGLSGENIGSDNPALGYWIGRAFWRQGHVAEAAIALRDLGFGTYGFAVLEAAIGTDNPGSQGVARSTGLVPREVYHVDSSNNRRGWTTFQRWRITRAEWQALVK